MKQTKPRRKPISSPIPAAKKGAPLSEFLTMAESAPVGIFVCDEKGACLFANRHVRRLVDIETGVTKKIEHWAIYEEDREMLIKAWKNAASKRKELKVEYRLPETNGKTVWILLQAVPFKKGDRILMHGTLSDVTQKKQAEIQMKTYNNWVNDEIEQEKRRLARELHDGVIQLLASAHFRVEGLRDEMESYPDTMKQDVAKAHLALSRAIEEIRRISHSMRPSLLDDLGLESAVRSLCKDFGERRDWVMNTKVQELGVRYNNAIELGLYRILQEVLRNIEKHAAATEVNVELAEVGGFLKLSIQDNGSGFDDRSVSPGLGLVHIKERVRAIEGVIRIQSKVGKGTLIEVKVPRQKITKKGEEYVDQNSVSR